MEKEAKKEVKWKKEPADKDYVSALSYLTLLYPKSSAELIVKRLEDAPLSEFKAKDIFRTSGLSELDPSNFHVRRFTEKIAVGDSISPLLLVREELSRRVLVVDGFHRLNAAYQYDEDLIVPSKIV